MLFKFVNHLTIFKGYFYAICMSFCLAINLIFIKMAPSLTGSEHSTIRYFFQLSIMGTVAKYKGLSFFSHEKAKLKWLIARGKFVYSYIEIFYLNLVISK